MNRETTKSSTKHHGKFCINWPISSSSCGIKHQKQQLVETTTWGQKEKTCSLLNLFFNVDYMIQSSTDQACIRHGGAGTDRDCPGASRKDHDWSLVVNISTWVTVKMRQRLRSGLQLVSCTFRGSLIIKEPM